MFDSKPLNYQRVLPNLMIWWFDDDNDGQNDDGIIWWDRNSSKMDYPRYSSIIVQCEAMFSAENLGHARSPCPQLFMLIDYVMSFDVYWLYPQSWWSVSDWTKNDSNPKKSDFLGIPKESPRRSDEFFPLQACCLSSSGSSFDYLALDALGHYPENWMVQVRKTLPVPLWLPSDSLNDFLISSWLWANIQILAVGATDLRPRFNVNYPTVHTTWRCLNTGNI